ncbi:MAG: pyridoxal-phosphate dependent enzyme [Calditrichaeota bacterium]|nr:pyridoxal-phosphate dependent enzyme [Calditrichota bacterium]
MTLTCTACKATYTPHQLQTVCRKCGQPLRADYFFRPKQLATDDLGTLPSLWRYHPFLPSIAESHRISLGEANTPLGVYDYRECKVYLKDETVNPTGSFKDRGMCLALSVARVLGVKRVALPSAGNAAIAAATYALAGGLACRVYLPETIPETFITELQDSGAEVILVGKTIAEAGAAMAEQLDDDWFNVSTLKEPYRIEGKKTLGLEIAEQLGMSGPGRPGQPRRTISGESGKADQTGLTSDQTEWDFPDVVVYPTGGGTGLIGIWKAFKELLNLDWVRKPLPRMVAVQTEGCAPVVQAFQDGADTTTPWPNPYTRALGLNVPSPLGGAWMLSILKESRGTALAVPEADITTAQKRLAEISGIPAGPEAAVAWRGMEVLMEKGWIKESERVVVVVTGDNRRYG